MRDGLEPQGQTPAASALPAVVAAEAASAALPGALPMPPPPGSLSARDATLEELTRAGMARLTAATVGASVGLSVITTYLPLILERFTSSSTLIGLAIGGEGLFALAIPLLGGAVSDRMWTRWGRRRPFMIFAAPFMASSLVLVPFQPGFSSVALATFFFFAAYHLYMAPYQSLLADLTPYGQQGRLQGMQTLMRGVGMFLGMVLAGVLFERWEPLPFLMAGAVVLGVTYFTVSGTHEVRPRRLGQAPLWAGRRAMLQGAIEVYRSTRREKKIVNLLAANFLWESSIAGIRPFIMLYMLHVLGQDTKRGALLLALVGATYVVAGVLGGLLADRFGRRRVMAWGLAIYLAGCLIAFFIRELWLAVLVLPVFGLGGAIVLTLPYALLMELMPRQKAGQFTGLFVMSRGLAIILAPVVAGVVIDFAARFDPATRGYAAIWPLASCVLLVSVLFFRRARAA